jgi:hypothetical protein
MADADHSRERGTRLLALALQAREQGRIEDAERLTQLATQASLSSNRSRAAAPPPRSRAVTSPGISETATARRERRHRRGAFRKRLPPGAVLPRHCVRTSAAYSAARFSLKFTSNR